MWRSCLIHSIQVFLGPVCPSSFNISNNQFFSHVFTHSAYQEVLMAQYVSGQSVSNVVLPLTNSMMQVSGPWLLTPTSIISTRVAKTNVFSTQISVWTRIQCFYLKKLPLFYRYDFVIHLCVLVLYSESVVFSIRKLWYFRNGRWWKHSIALNLDLGFFFIWKALIINKA